VNVRPYYAEGSKPRRRPGEQVGGGGGDGHQVGRLTDPHMRDIGYLAPDVGCHRLARERLPGGRADESQSVGGRDNPDPVPGLT
jgi:hypothetical protein